MIQNQVIHQIHSFRAAVQFLTCIPVGSTDEIPAVARLDMVYWYPLVGAIIGVILILGEVITSPLNVFLQASLLVTLWVVVTGGLHLDGLADCADAWVGGLGSRKKTLKIMNDPRSGPVAVIAVVLTLILKIATLAEFHEWTALILVPFAARLLIIPAFLWLPYTKESGLGGDIQKAVSIRKRKYAIGIVAVGTLAPLLFISLWLWISLVAVSIMTFLLWRACMIRRLRGFSGDCIGLLVELSELVLLLAFVIFEVVV